MRLIFIFFLTLISITSYSSSVSSGRGGGGTGVPGGSDTQIQFNDGGSFGGDADLTWDKTTNTMTLGGETCTATKIGNWDDAFSWGDHAGLYAALVHTHDDRYYTETELDAGQLDTRYYTETEIDAAGYLTSESDPVFGASAASGIAAGDITNWNSAYSWGDHAGLYSLLGHDHDGRYYTETEIDGFGFLTSETDPNSLHLNGDNQMAGNITFATDDTYDIGASDDNRPKTGYFATSVVVGDASTTITDGAISQSGANPLIFNINSGEVARFDGTTGNFDVASGKRIRILGVSTDNDNSALHLGLYSRIFEKDDGHLYFHHRGSNKAWFYYYGGFYMNTPLVMYSGFDIKGGDGSTVGTDSDAFDSHYFRAITGPAAPSTAAGVLYADSGDSNKLKFKAQGGTVYDLTKTSTSTIELTADDTEISSLGKSFVLLSSDSVTAADRTFTIGTTSVVTGHNLTVCWDGTNAGELLDTGNQKLSAAWTPTDDDCISLIFDGTDWLETSRSTN